MRRVATVLILTTLIALAGCGSGSTSNSRTGGSSPSDVARLYMAATLRGDIAAMNGLTASHRGDCPPSRGDRFNIGFPVPADNERIVAHVTRERRTWRVTLTITDGDASSTGSDVVVVRYRGRYFAC
jgi:hypothetical protein